MEIKKQRVNEANSDFKVAQHNVHIWVKNYNFFKRKIVLIYNFLFANDYQTRSKRPEVRICERRQECKIESKHAFDQESDQEKDKLR